MRSVDVTFEVTAPSSGVDTPYSIATTVHLPDEPSVPGVVAVGLPGGGYNRTYWDLDAGGLDGYSQARYHSDRGWVFVACDPVGVGDSSRPDVPHTIAQVADLHAAAIEQLRARLTAGSFVDGLPAAPEAKLIGLGQSMGGCFTVVAQGNHACYDAIGVLGYSVRHTELPLPEGTFAEVPIGADGTTASQEDVTAALMASFRWVFHWDDVPAAIAGLDMASVPMRKGSDVAPWGRQAGTLACAVDMLTPGVVAAQAAAIDCPVLIAQGQRDVVARPREEPAVYAASDHITVVCIPTMAHMHNFASTRVQMWDAIHFWGGSLVRRPTAGISI